MFRMPIINLLTSLIMKWKCFYFALFLSCMLFPQVSQGQFLTADVFYSNTDCNRKTRVEFRLFNNGNPAAGFEIRFLVFPSNFDVTTPGDFGPYNNSSFVWTTGSFAVNSSAHYTSKFFCGELLNLNGTSISAFFYQNGQLIQSIQIPFAPFNQINGSTQPALLSNLLALPNGPLLSANDAQNQAQRVHIEGTLIVDTDYTFADEVSHHSEISMGANAKIIVSNEAELTITGSQVYGCDAMWESIEVEAGSALNIATSRLEGAKRAVLLKSNFDPLGPTTEVDIFRSEFLDNEIGVYSEESPIGANFINLSLAGTGFKGSKTNAFAGLYLHDMPQVNIFPDITGQTFYFARFDRLKYGIWASNSDIGILGPRIRENQTGIHVENQSTLFVQGWQYVEEFQKNYESIQSIESDLYVKECDLLETSFGIDLRSILAHQTVIEDNNISTNKYGIRIFAKEAAKGDILRNRIEKVDNTKGYCIYFGGESSSNNDVWDIRNNELYVLEGSLANVHFDNAENIHFKENVLLNLPAQPAIELHGGYNNEFECNQILDATVGLEQLFSYGNAVICNEFDVTDIAYQLTGWCDYTTIKGNTLNGNNHDLAFGSQVMAIGISGDQPALSLMEQHGNLFEGNGSPQAINFGTTGMVNMSNFHVYSPLNADYLPTFSASTTNWFSDIMPLNGVFSCQQHDCSLPFGGGVAGPIDVDYAIKNNTVLYAPFLSEVQWIGHNHLYHRLSDQKQVDPNFQTYYTQKGSSDVGMLAQVNNQVNASMNLTGAQQQQLDNLYDAKEGLLQAFGAYTTQAKSLDPDSIAFYKNATQLVNQDLRALLATKKNSMQASLASINQNNASINTLLAPADNEKQLNTIMMALLNRKNFEPSHQEIVTLEAIAGGCPLEGGDAVFRARAYLALTDSIYDWDDSTACSAPVKPSKRLALDIVSPSLSLYPNPATNTLSIELDEAVAASSLVQIMGIDGKSSI